MAQMTRGQPPGKGKLRLPLQLSLEVVMSLVDSLDITGLSIVRSQEGAARELMLSCE